MKRKIAVVTTSRADYGHLYWVLRDLSAHTEIDLKLIALGAHLAPEFGNTIDEIERDGFHITERIECLLSSDTDIGMAKTIGIATLSLADCLGQMRPDVLLLIADRYEMLAPASVALALRVPIAHIEGGEISEGAIDDAVRNALTKMSHLHFTPTENSRRRVIAMDEEAWRVTHTGAPSLDHLRRHRLPTTEELERDLELDLHRPTLVVAYHPVTIARDTTHEADAVFAALGELAEEETVDDKTDFNKINSNLSYKQRQIVFCFPNADAGSRHLINRAQAFCDAHADAHLFVNLAHLKYWSLLRAARVLVGNSSSGIMETASVKLPTVNIGARQKGRERARNVIDAAPERAEIVAAVRHAESDEFRQSLEGLVNPYGDGYAAQRIVEVLANVELGERLLMKRRCV